MANKNNSDAVLNTRRSFLFRGMGLAASVFSAENILRNNPFKTMLKKSSDGSERSQKNTFIPSTHPLAISRTKKSL